MSSRAVRHSSTRRTKLHAHLKLHTILIYTIAAVLVLYAHCGCSSTRHSVEEAAWPAAGAAGGAGVGMLIGPIGAIAGAGIGAAIVAVTHQNAELRDGSLQGDGAAEKEIARLRGELATTRGALNAKADRASFLDHALADVYRWIKLGAAIFGVMWILSHPKGRAAIGGAFRVAVSLITRQRAPKGLSS